MVKIKKFKKHINEATDANGNIIPDNNVLQPAAQPAAQPAQPVQLATAQPAQPQQLAPALQLAPAQPAQPQQLAPAQQPQQQTQYLLKLADFIKNGSKGMGNVYWVMTVNLPEEIQKVDPNFKNDNPAAKPAIDAWNAYKQDPKQETYDVFYNAITAYANPLEAQQQPAQLEPQQLQQALAQPQATAEAVAFNFKNALNENLRESTKMDYYKKVLESYFLDE